MADILSKYKNQFPDIPRLYDWQQNVIDKILRKKNTLAIVPTGGGKSLLYQLTSLELEGVTLVISPLLALMEEQVKELTIKRGIKALALNSRVPFKEQREILRDLTPDSYKLIYVSPERLQNPFFRASLVASGVNISMIVIDEAHCISQWGSSFRPDYGQINNFTEFLENKGYHTFLLCLTATLSQKARVDVISEFKINAENVYISPNVIRDNLELHFQQVEEEDEKIDYLKSFLSIYKPNKSLAYLYSKYKCEEYADSLSNEYRTDYYHAEVSSEEKTVVYEKFSNGEIDILFATTAFGMGINIPDIDSVIHLQIPNSIEEYYQHVGRGWRKKTENKTCNCLALWSDVNFDRRKERIENQKYTIEYLYEAYKSLIGSTKIKYIGQVVNKEREALLRAEYNLQLLRYKLEKYGVIKFAGEINGSPLTIELKKNTDLWDRIVQEAESGIDSFGYVCKQLKISIASIMEHLYEQDLIENIKTLPATKKDLYFEILKLELSQEIALNIVNEINEEVDFRVTQLSELYELFNSDEYRERLKAAFI